MSGFTNFFQAQALVSSEQQDYLILNQIRGMTRDPPTMSIIIEYGSYGYLKINVSPNDCVGHLALEIEHITGITIDQMKVYFSGQPLDLRQTLASYKIQKDCIIKVIKWAYIRELYPLTTQQQKFFSPDPSIYQA